jgi:hypothetical protein
MRCSVSALTFIAALLGLMHARGQVLQNTNYDQELTHAKSLLAGATSTDIPHHIHYDLRLYDRDGHESTATYDIYRDPILYERTEIKAGNYQLTRITNLRDHVEWLHYSGDMPLKIADFDQVRILPQAAVNRFAKEPQNIKPMARQELEGAPLLCANDDQGTTICFNPMIRLFAYAQMFNRTIMYDQWLPIGSHTVPGAIRIYEDKKLLVEATGTVEAVNKFPDHFMQVPDSPSQPAPETQYKIIKSKQMDMSEPRYGNIQVTVSVDEKGHVTKESIVDSDDKHLEGITRKFVKDLVFEPRIKDGQPIPFDAVLYIEHYPF